MVFGVLFLRLLLCQVLQNVAFISRDILGARKRKQTDRQRKGDLHKSSKRTRVIWQTRLLATRPRGLTAKENDVFEVTLASPATTRVSSPPLPTFLFVSLPSPLSALLSLLQVFLLVSAFCRRQKSNPRAVSRLAPNVLKTRRCRTYPSRWASGWL